MNIFFHTLGCKVNQYETEAIREGFLKHNHTDNPNLTPDAVIINSCTVTAESDRKTRQMLRRFRRKYPYAIIVLTGCMVQAFPEKSASLTEADIVIGNKDIEKIISVTENYNGKRICDFSKHLRDDEYNTPPISSFEDRTRAFMKIEDGCDRFCTYCIIPYSRGRVRSRSCDDIKAEANRLAENGYKEIVLVGINLSSYGKGENFNLCDAVDAVCEVEGIKRVRLGSIEPDLISDEMLMRLRSQKKFCPQFHLSLQSGCDETLKRMNRHYDTDFYDDLVRRIRKIFDNASITTDIMVGFAGETEEEFEKSLAFVKKTGFARCHIFVYSRRSGTLAADFENQIPESEKAERARRMNTVSRESEKEFLLSQVGKVLPVLFEKRHGNITEGYTENYTRVIVSGDIPVSGKILNVRLISAKEDFCEGVLE